MLLELTKNVNGFHTGQREGTGFYFLHYKDSVTLFLHLLPTPFGTIRLGNSDYSSTGLQAEVISRERPLTHSAFWGLGHLE